MGNCFYICTIHVDLQIVVKHLLPDPLAINVYHLLITIFFSFDPSHTENLRNIFTHLGFYSISTCRNAHPTWN